MARRQRRRGTVMLVCVFITGLISLMVMGILESLSVQTATITSIEAQQQASYMADAGIQHAQSQLRDNPDWKGRLRWNDVRSDASNGKDRRRYSVTVTQSATETVITSFGFSNSTRQTHVLRLPKGGS